MPASFAPIDFGDSLLHLENLRPRLDQRGFEAPDFVGDVRRIDMRYRATSSVIVANDMDRPARNPGETPAP